MTASRALALVAGLVFWILGLVLESRQTEAAPFAAYGFRWFRELGPGEPVAYVRLFATGIPAAFLLGFGAAPLVRRVEERWAGPAGDRGFLLAAAGIALLASLLTALVAVTVLHTTPVTDDENVYLFQARLLAAGHAALPAPPLSEFLGNVFVVTREGRWFGQYPPGHPLLLAPFTLLGLPRLLPVLLAGVNVFLTALVLRRTAPAGWSLLGAALLATSPLFLLTGATLLSHPTAYAAFALAAWGTLRLREGDGLLSGAAVGIGLGLLVATRPYTGVTLGGVLGVTALYLVWRDRRVRALAPLLLGLAAFAVLFLGYNRAVTGDALVTGYQAVRAPGQVELGFGTIAQGVAPHTPIQGMRNAAYLGMRLLAWSFAGPLVLFALAAPIGRRRPDLLLALALLLGGLVSYIAYWSIGVNDTGPVKTYELLLPLGVLLVTGAARLAPRREPGRVLATILATVLVGATLFWPGRVEDLDRLVTRVALPLTVTEETVKTPALVFVERMQPTPGWSWVYGRPNPRPDLSDPILYVRNAGPENRRYQAVHPGRNAYRLTFAGRVPRVEPLGRPDR